MSKQSKVRALAARSGTDGEKSAALARLPAERQRLTEKVVAALPVPPKGNRLYRDRPGKGRDLYVPGFAVRVTAGGNRSFVLNYVSSGVERRLAIGPWPVLTVEKARLAAQTFLARIVLDAGPLQERREREGELTVEQFCRMFIEKHVARKRSPTQEQYQSLIANEILPRLGRKTVAAVTRQDVRDMFEAISDRGVRVTANRAVAVASVLFSFAIEQNLCTTNPARGIKRNFERRAGRTSIS